MKYKISLDNSAFNDHFFPFYRSKARYCHCWGGAGSGKSVNAAWKLIIRMLDEPGHRFLIARKVGRTIRQSQYQLLKDIIYGNNLSEMFTFRDTDMTINCLNGSMILASGLDDVEKLKSIQGLTGIWMEEATEFDRDDFLQLTLRVRGYTPYYKQFILTYNPIDEGHWINEMCHKKKDEDTELFWTTYIDNKFIDADYKKQLDRLAEIDKTFYKIYALGMWATPENIIYPEWIINASFPGTEKVYGLDFGFNNPCAFAEVQVSDMSVYVKELIYESKMTNSDLIKKFEELNIDKKSLIIADTAEPKSIEDISRAGYYIMPADKGPNSVLSGIRFVKQFKINIHPESINCLNEIKTYKWKEDRNGKVLDEPVKFNDHLMDAIRMPLYTYFPDKIRNQGKVYEKIMTTRQRTNYSLTAGY